MSAVIGWRARSSMFLRSFTVQGSWNYESLIGTGFAFVMLPALQRIYRDDPVGLARALARHAAVFNSHPFLANVAAGAVAKLEAEGADPALIQRFKDALRGSLGSLGDRLVWMAWRPAAILLGIVLLLVGAPWWAAVGIFLVTYNALHLFLRLWGLRVGLDSGLQVASLIRNAPMQILASRAAQVGAFLAGATVVLLVAGGAAEPARIAIILAGAGLGLALGIRARPVAAIAVAATWAVSLIIGILL